MIIQLISKDLLLTIRKLKKCNKKKAYSDKLQLSNNTK